MTRNKSDFNIGSRPALEDVNIAYNTGKITKDEAEGMGRSMWHGSEETPKSEAEAHRRAGLSKEAN
jgi:hypothetical protein